MAINEKLIVQEAAAPATDADPNIMLDLNAGDVDSYDGDGDVWYDIHDFEFKPTTNVSEHFNTVIWSGDGASTRSITEVGFQPDLVWVKARQAQNHTIYDSVRGTGKYLASDGATAETTSTTYGQLTSFDSDGFTGSEGSNQTYSFFNSSSQTYVAWCFNAGGNPDTNTNGTIDSTVRANNDLGFSIAKYIGNGSSTGATIGHGLDTPPEMIIVKDLDDTSDWAVYTSVTGNTKKLLLNSRNGAATSGVWNNTSPTSSVFTVRYSQTNELDHDFIAYSFTSKRGVSKVGSYIGNGTTNNKIYTGFEPAFFMLKNTSLDNTGWLIKDNVRGENSKTILANSNATEYNTTSYWTCDFERDGVRLTYGADNEFNRNGDTYIFYAVAKDTNETELADTVGFKPSIDPEDHFNTVIYTGDDTSSRDIEGVGFQPDLVWAKNRTAANSHVLIDAVRGASKFIFSDSSAAELTTNTTLLSSINSDGFTVGYDGTDVTNGASNDYVAWCFNAGGNEVTNTDGTVNSTVRANNDLGFSIVKYNGLNTAVTAGHGLESPPEMVICKPLAIGAWAVWHKDMASDLDKNYIPLTTGATSPNASSLWNYSNWGATKIGSSNPLMFGANNDIVAYCFTSKRGVSKVGSYTGTGASGNKIFTEFEPAFLIIKNTTSAGNEWNIYDNVRDTDSIKDTTLWANSSTTETTASQGGAYPISFDRDGFTINHTYTPMNGNGDNYIYYAVAKNTNNEEPYLELNLEADSYSGSGDWLDSSGNGNNGTITDATFEEELGNYFDLDGSGDYIDAPTSGVLSGDFTVEMWWNFDTLSAGYRMLFGSSGYQGGSGLGHYIENGRLRTWVSVSGSTSNVLNGSGTDLTTNKWQHVVLTRSGGTYTQYIDTNQVGQGSGTTASLDGANSRIGGHYTQNGHDINAKVGQVRLYSTALSQAQIRQNFNFTKPKYPNEFHGSLINMDSSNWNASGYFDFNGSNEFVDLDTSIGSTFWANNWSASAWVYFDSTSSANQCIFTSHGLAYNYLYTNNNTQLKYSNDNGVTITTSSGTISASQWHHIVVTRSSVDGTVIYVDKVSVGTDSSSNNAGTSNASGAKPQIGAYTSTGSYPNQYPLDGRVSKFKLYNKALTQSEVDALYNEGE